MSGIQAGPGLAGLVGAAGRQAFALPGIWKLTRSVRGTGTWSDYLDRYGYEPVVNSSELEEAERLFRRKGPFLEIPPLPSDFLQPVVSLPGPITLDLISSSGVRLVSEKLRTAMALPPEAAQFLPIELRTDSDEVRDKGYMWLAWICQERDIVDRARSTCLWKNVSLFQRVQTQWIDSNTGTIIVRDDFAPYFDLFEPTDAPAYMCATPALEERVRAARCDGVVFYDLSTPLHQPLWVSDEHGLYFRTPE